MMIRRNILSELAENTVSEEDADGILSAILGSSAAPDVKELLGLSRIEWTAYSHGASLTEVAAWRKSGWPCTCTVCGLQIEIEKFGWKVVDVDDFSKLKHVECPSYRQ